MSLPFKKLGIVMGGGGLPSHLIDACSQNKWPYFILALRGQADPRAVEGHPHVWASVGRPRSALARLRAENVTDIVMVGYVSRAALLTWRWDLMALQLLLKLGCKLFTEDSLLRDVIHFIESQGFRVRSVTEVCPDLKMPAGVLGKIAPDASLKKLIDIGIFLAKEEGARDVGQAVIVTEDGQSFKEGSQGTDALIRTYSALRNPLIRGILVKVCKPQQDRRIDLPTIGIDTIKNAADAGLAGVVMEAGDGLILDQKQIIQYANTLGLFLYGYKTHNT